MTFLFSDIEGSTQRWARDRTAMQDAVRLHDRLMREAIANNGGHVFKTIGDAFCAAFGTPESAAAAALEAQRALAAADFAVADGLRVRMALNTGTADERDGDYFGPTLNRVARLLALGHGGQVLLSSAAAVLVRGNPPPDATLIDLGDRTLKDLEGVERVYQLVAPGLRSDFPELHADQPPQPWLVPTPMHTRYFTGRDDVLAVLHQQLAERHRAALSGLGGVGKTQTAIEFALRHRADYPGGVFWVNAETLSGLTSGFVAIAATLRLPAAESSDQDVVVKAVLEWLNGAAGWLLILDNVDNRRDVQPFVPERGRGDLLITSRESVFPEVGIPRAIVLRDLAGEEAVRFLLIRTGREDAGHDDRSPAAELAAELGYLPLALEQAAAYIAETSAGFAVYLAAFRKRRVALLEKSGGLVAHDTVSVTWTANFEAVQSMSPAAADVLRIGALLAPDAIPFKLFLDGAGDLGDAIAQALADPDDLAMVEMLRPLARYSLIRADAESRAFSVHRLVQEIVWSAIPELERLTYVERVLCALDAAFPEGDYANWAQCERLVSHVTALAGRLDSYDVKPEIAERVLNRTGRYLRERSRPAEAQPLHELALRIGERALGPEHPNVATDLNDLANIHWDRGHFAEAQALNERALAIRELALGPDHLDVASSLNLLGLIHREQGRYVEAVAPNERALAIRERALGPDHPEVGRSVNNLGNVKFAQGLYGQAQALYERALRIWENAHGPDHPRVASALNNLGNVYVDQGRYAEALPFFERSQAIRERALGPDDPDVAASLNNLANALIEQGRYSEALPLDERALAVWQRALGPDHPDVANSLDHLGESFDHLGRDAEAEASFQRALTIRERAFGPDHPDLGFSLDGLAHMYARLGRPGDAELLYERALQNRERALGPDHPHLAKSLIGLAALRKQGGRNDKALAYYERALALKAQAFAPDHPELEELRTAIVALRSAP